MQAERVLELLRTTTPRILEEVAFVFAEASDSAEPFDGEVLEASIDFNGPLTGSLRLTTSTACAAGLAANVLGVDAEDAAAVAYTSDALGETLNMLCGAVLLQLFGAVDSSHSGVPQVIVRAHASTSVPGETVSFVTDEGHRIDAGSVCRRADS